MRSLDTANAAPPPVPLPGIRHYGQILLNIPEDTSNFQGADLVFAPKALHRSLVTESFTGTGFIAKPMHQSWHHPVKKGSGSPHQKGRRKFNRLVRQTPRTFHQLWQDHYQLSLFQCGKPFTFHMTLRGGKNESEEHRGTQC